VIAAFNFIELFSFFFRLLNVKMTFLLVDELIFARLIGSKAIKRNVGAVIVILDHPSERFIERNRRVSF